jgi:hypothetical protein
MDWKFVLLSLIGLFGIIYSLLSSRGKEKEPPFPLSLHLKALAFGVPLLLLLYFFLKPPFSTEGARSAQGIWNRHPSRRNRELRPPIRPSPPFLISPDCLLSTILIFATALYLLPYDLSFLSFGFILALSLFLFLFSSLKETFKRICSSSPISPSFSSYPSSSVSITVI